MMQGLKKHQKIFRCPIVSFFLLKNFFSPKMPKNSDLKRGSEKEFLVYKPTVGKIVRIFFNRTQAFKLMLQIQKKIKIG